MNEEKFFLRITTNGILAEKILRITTPSRTCHILMGLQHTTL